MSSSGDPVLLDLVAQAVELLEGGDTRAFEALCDGHPAHAIELRARVDELRSVGLVGPPPADEAIPEQLGGFLLLRRIGGGGMGVVYEAEQSHPGRRVALKLVRPDQLYFPGARKRFARELEAVSRLAHPGIVPVFAAGEERGIPYYAMELVRGATLEEVFSVLRGRDASTLTGSDLLDAVTQVVRVRDGEPPMPTDRPRGEAGRAGRGRATGSGTRALRRRFAGTWTAACLVVAREIAGALAHAHARGVLHRDIKPSNIMLTPDGRALLLDFGLALTAGDVRLTSTGSHLGSLAFMSPEQVRGEHGDLDARTDVYSLGVTLYELLTLRAPFASDDVETTRRRVLEARPEALRKLNPSLPRDAETVCATAMEKDRARRYAGAEEFGADLANVLELRPISARPAGVLLRARRWAQRRPAFATGVVLGALLLVAGPLGWELNRMRNAVELQDAFDRSERAGVELSKALARSERDFRAALSAIGHVLRNMASEELEDAPGMQRVRLEALDRAVALFSELEQDRDDDVLVLEEGAELYASRAAVQRDLGRDEQACDDFARAVAMRRSLLAHDPSPVREGQLGDVLVDEGNAQQAMLRPELAVQRLAEGVALVRRAAEAHPDDVETQRLLAASLANLSEPLVLLDRYEEAHASLDEALQRVRALGDGSASTAWSEGRIQEDLAELAEQRDEPEDALDHAELALASHRLAHELDPAKRYFAFDVCSALTLVGGYAQRLDRFELSERTLIEALDVIDGLLVDFPDARLYRKRRANILEQLGIGVGRRNRHREALSLFGESARELEVLAAADPNDCRVQVALARSEMNRVNSLIQLVERGDEARALLSSARARLGACAQASARGSESLGRFSEYLAALLECTQGTPDVAAPLVEAYAAAAGDDAQLQRRAADLYNEQILGLRRYAAADEVRDAAEARARDGLLMHLRRALELGYDDFAELATTPALDPLRGDPELAELLTGAEVRASP